MTLRDEITGLQRQPERLCEPLEWDSRFFGLSVARAIPSRVTPESCRGILAWCDSHRVECLYFLAPADDRTTVRTLEDAAFRLVDVRVTYERTLDTGGDPAPAGIRAARPEDIPALRELAGTSHRETRFYFDGQFDLERCDELYRVWIENSCRGYADHVLVAERNGEAVGYLTLHRGDGPTARLGLTAIHPALRRQGVGRDLMRTGLAWLAAQSAVRVVNWASARNVASQALQQSVGFRIAGVDIWYHRWFRQPAA